MATFPAEYAIVAPLLRESVAKDPDADVKRVARESLELITQGGSRNGWCSLLKEDRDENVRVLAAMARWGR